MMMYQISSMFTLTADFKAVVAFKCNLLNADFMSSFLIQILVCGYSFRKDTIWWMILEKTKQNIHGSRRALLTRVFTDFPEIPPGNERPCVTRFLGSNFPNAVTPRCVATPIGLSTNSGICSWHSPGKIRLYPLIISFLIALARKSLFFPADLWFPLEKAACTSCILNPSSKSSR